jgi:hypothetical protein
VEAFWVKVAVTDFAVLIVTMQEPVPWHAPLQPLKLQPVKGDALRVTGVPLEYVWLQLLPQLM